MIISPVDISGLIHFEPKAFHDDRGLFFEAYNKSALVEIGITADFLQDNQSLSRRAGTLRGLHYQAAPRAQAKLVRVVRGRLWDVAVDIRRGSPSFGRWAGFELSAENRRQLFIPAGFAHGFVTLEPDTEILYKVDAPYAPDCERGIRWDDPDLAIRWPLPGGRAPVIAPRDAALPELADTGPDFRWGERPPS